MMETTVNILIVGGGPTGFGSAWRLNELIERKLLHREIKWLLVDRANHIGGAAASSVDEHGFTWDGGHHVIYSRYKYFDDLLFKLMGDKLRYVERRGWVWIKNPLRPISGPRAGVPGWSLRSTQSPTGRSPFPVWGPTDHVT